MSKATDVIILRETIFQSVASDAATFATFAAMIGLGVYLESTAMQWTGAVVFFVSALSRTKAKRLTIAEARAHLDDLEAAHDHP